MVGGAAIVSFVVAFIVLRVILWRFARHALDLPNERSLHERPVPRTGGIAVVLGALAAAVLGAAELWLPMALALLLAVISFVDDVRGIPTAARLLVHLAAGAAFVWYMLSPMNLLEMALLILAVAWITNLYNFMDGSDGLAGGMAVIGFAAYGIASAGPLSTISFALAAASMAFLIHNFHPARIFLGDVGSIPLGFLAAALGIQGWRDDAWPLWFPLLVFAPFIGDATLTLIKRLVRGEKVWQAHREHYYQRMVRMGLGHRRTALVGYAVMAACAGFALAGRGQAPLVQAACFGAGAALLAALAMWVDMRWRRSAAA